MRNVDTKNKNADWVECPNHKGDNCPNCKQYGNPGWILVFR